MTGSPGLLHCLWPPPARSLQGQIPDEGKAAARAPHAAICMGGVARGWVGGWVGGWKGKEALHRSLPSACTWDTWPSNLDAQSKADLIASNTRRASHAQRSPASQARSVNAVEGNRLLSRCREAMVSGYLLAPEKNKFLFPQTRCPVTLCEWGVSQAQENVVFHSLRLWASLAPQPEA